MSTTIAISSWVFWKRTLSTSPFLFMKEWLLQALSKGTGLKEEGLRGTLRGLLTLSVVVSTNTTMQLSPFQPGKIPAHLQLQSEVNESGKQTNKQSNRAEMLVC